MKMAKKGLVEIAVIMDESGSMESIKSDAIGGFNSFLAGQKSAEGDAKLTLAFFDHHYRLIYDGKDIKEVEPINNEIYKPNGWTALLDAVGNTIDNILIRQAETPEEERPERTICVIITDGHENRSTKFSREELNKRIKISKGLLNWEFLFLGANIDSFSEASSLGISSDRTATFHASGAGTTAMYNSVDSAVTSYRLGGTINTDWTKEINARHT